MALIQSEQITAEQREAVEQALRQRTLTPRVRERLEMVKAVALGQDLASILAWSGRAPRTIERWVGRFQTGGVAAVTDAPRSGRPARADTTYKERLERAVTTPPRHLGLGFDVWTSARLATYLAETTGVQVAPSWVRGLLRQQRFVCRRPKHTLKQLQDAAEVAACQAELAVVKTKVAADPARYELHYEDETHVDTNPHLTRVWQRKGEQALVPAAGTNRRLTVFGSVIAQGQGRVEVLTADQSSAGFLQYLQALDQRHRESGREIFLVLDNGSAHTSQISRTALGQRAGWLHVVWLARYSPELNPKEREWRLLKRDARGHLARDLRAFADAVLAGLHRLGGACCTILDQVPAWFLAGHRKPPTGRKPGRPRGAKDSYKRSYRRKNLPTPT